MFFWGLLTRKSKATKKLEQTTASNIKDWNEDCKILSWYLLKIRRIPKPSNKINNAINAFKLFSLRLDFLEDDFVFFFAMNLYENYRVIEITSPFSAKGAATVTLLLASLTTV